MPTDPYTPTTDELAQFLRTVDGDHTMGAGELAEAVAGSSWLARTVAAEIDKAADEVAKIAPYGCEMDYTGKEDPGTAAWVEGLHDAHDVLRARAETIREKGLE